MQSKMKKPVHIALFSLVYIIVPVSLNTMYFVREKVRDLENLVRRKDSEISSQKTKINQLHASLK
jgi:hypothetical protein